MRVTYKPPRRGRRSSILLVGSQYDLLRVLTANDGEHKVVLKVGDGLRAPVTVPSSHVEFPDDGGYSDPGTTGAANTLDATLTERGSTHEDFKYTASTTQRMLSLAEVTPKWAELTEPQREALHMIFSKIARILNGNPNHKDNWHDIAGYASLVEKELV